MIELLLLAAVVATSTLSGVFGMAGGMILLAIYLMVLPVADAMVLHGVTQVAANGFRFWLLRRHADWKVVALVVAGGLVAAAGFAAAEVVLSRSAVMILMGAIPLCAMLLPRSSVARSAGGGDRPALAVGCGLLSTSAQLTAGVAGPVVDHYFIASKLDRFGVIATKSAMQTAGHLLKVVYFGAWVGDGGAAVAGWLFLAAPAVALVGTGIGRALLEHLSERQFRRSSRAIIATVATLLMARGLVELL